MTKEDILAAAASVISERGYHAASMQDIANAVNLKKSSLYHHFSGKQQILLALLDSGLDALIQEMEQVIAKPLRPEEKLHLAMVSYLKTMIEYQDLSAILLLEHRSLEPDLRLEHIPRRDHFERLWRLLIEEGKDSGDFNCTDPSITSKALLGVLNWTITWFKKDGKYSPSEIADDFASLFLHGLLKRT